MKKLLILLLLLSSIVAMSQPTTGTAASWNLKLGNNLYDYTNDRVLASPTRRLYDTSNTEIINFQNRAAGFAIITGATYYARLKTSYLTGDVTLEFPNQSGTIAITSDLNNYVKVIGDTMTGNLFMSDKNITDIDTLKNVNRIIVNGTVDSGTPDAAVRITRILNSNSAAGHGFRDMTDFAQSGFAYAAYDAAFSMNGGATSTYDHGIGFQSRATYDDTTNTGYAFGDFPTVNSLVSSLSSFESSPTILPSGKVGSRFGVRIRPGSNFGTLFNNYAIYIDDQSTASPIADDYAIYHPGSSLIYTGGKMGISIATPTSELHIDKGTATASNIQFTAGTTTGQTSSDGLQLGLTTTGKAVLNQRENLDLAFNTQNIERATIKGDGQFLIGTTTANPGSLGILRVGQGTSTIDIGQHSAGVGSVWLGKATPSTTNYSLAGDATNTYLNAVTGGTVYFMHNNAIRGSYTSQMFSFTPGGAGTNNTYFTFTEPASTGGTAKGIVFTAGAHTGQTASTPVEDVLFNLRRSVTFANGAITKENFFNITGGTTMNFASGSNTVTDAVTCRIGMAPIPGNFAAITRPWSLLVAENAAFGTKVTIGDSSTSPTGTITIQEKTLGSRVLAVHTTATNDDPGYDISQNRITTTNATVTYIDSIQIPASTTVKLRAELVARRTGGTAGTAEDGAAYNLKAAYKNVAGTATAIGSTITETWEDQAGWDVSFSVNGSYVRVAVTGATDNNITWHLSKFENSKVNQ